MAKNFVTGNWKMHTTTAGLDVILCSGEALSHRDADETEAVLDRQLLRGLTDVPADTLSRLTIAYEPVWAIGAHGHHATPKQAGESHAVIRRRFAQLFGEQAARTLVIRYGGASISGGRSRTT